MKIVKVSLSFLRPEMFFEHSKVYILHVAHFYATGDLACFYPLMYQFYILIIFHMKCILDSKEGGNGITLCDFVALLYSQCKSKCQIITAENFSCSQGIASELSILLYMG